MKFKIKNLINTRHSEKQKYACVLKGMDKIFRATKFATLGIGKSLKALSLKR